MGKPTAGSSDMTAKNGTAAAPWMRPISASRSHTVHNSRPVPTTATIVSARLSQRFSAIVGDASATDPSTKARRAYGTGGIEDSSPPPIVGAHGRHAGAQLVDVCDTR